jgi:hypothetical protein
MAEKARRRLPFCPGIFEPLSLRTGLILPYMLGLVTCFYCFCYFSKKKMGEKMHDRILFSLLIAFQILHVFLPDISVHCALIAYAYI